MNFSRFIGKYWLLQGLIIAIIVSYIFGLGVGIIYVFNNSSSSEQPKEEVTILLLIESNNPEFPINFSSSTVVPINTTLLDHLNNTIGENNWDGVNYGVGGWFIQGLFNISEYGPWHWFIYYRLSGAEKWNSSPVGVSMFILNQDYEIKFIFDTE